MGLPVVVVGGKAYAIFALLFGFSFYIMEQNALRRGQDFRLRFCWRMLLLFGFGCFNAAFFCGEVLVLYSIVGFVLPLVCRLKNKTLLIIAAVLMLQPVDWIKMAYAALTDSQSTILEFNFEPYWNNSMKMLSEGNFVQTVLTNLWDGQIFSLAWAWGAGRFCQTASLFILGLVAGRIQWFADTPHNRSMWAKTFAAALLAFMPLYGLSTLLPDFASTLPLDTTGIAGMFTSKSFMTPMMLIVNSLHKFCFMTMIVTGLLFAFYSTRLARPMRYIMPLRQNESDQLYHTEHHRFVPVLSLGIASQPLRHVEPSAMYNGIVSSDHILPLVDEQPFPRPFRGALEKADMDWKRQMTYNILKVRRDRRFLLSRLRQTTLPTSPLPSP